MNETAWSDPRVEAVIRLLGARTGLSFQPHSRPTAERGVHRAMKQSGVQDLSEYSRLIAMDAAALDRLIVELTVGETYFFREPAQFEFIREVVLPELRRRWGPEHVIRAWSAATASGEEAYSLAMLFSQEGLTDRSHILATDISRAALSRAREATYRKWSLRGEGSKLARQYLLHDGDNYIVPEKIRRHVVLEYLNLALDVYPSIVSGTWALDLILCRNVLIYFDRETIRAVADRLYQSLAEGGWLITASPDPPLDAYAPFESVVTDSGVYYRRGAAAGTLPASGVQQPSYTLRAAAQDFAADSSAWQHAETLKHWPAGETEVETPAAFDEVTEAAREHAPADPLGDARRALLDGDYERAIELTEHRDDDPVFCAVHVQALANLNTQRAEQKCAAATSRHPLSTELHYLHAVLLMEQDRDDEAARAVRRAIYLDRTLAIAHFTLGSILRRLGDLDGARRAFRNTRELCMARPADDHVRLSDGETAARLAKAAEIQLHGLTVAQEVKR